MQHGNGDLEFGQRDVLQRIFQYQVYQKGVFEITKMKETSDVNLELNNFQ